MSMHSCSVRRRASPTFGVELRVRRRPVFNGSAIDAGGCDARNFIAAVKPFGKPFDRVVISHEHPDHIVGLSQFPRESRW